MHREKNAPVAYLACAKGTDRTVLFYQDKKDKLVLNAVMRHFHENARVICV